MKRISLAIALIGCLLIPIQTQAVEQSKRITMERHCRTAPRSDMWQGDGTFCIIIIYDYETKVTCYKYGEAISCIKDREVSPNVEKAHP